MQKNWLQHPVKLSGETIELIPLEPEHFEELFNIAMDKRIWEYYPIDCSDYSKFLTHFTTALKEREKGTYYPFVILHKQTNKLIGSTSLFDIHPNDRNLEIGWTWISPMYWSTWVNFECKHLLLTYCFEVLKCVRVQIKTNDLNIRSQKAIKKIGGKFEGVLRKTKIRDDGTIRNSVYFSIIDDEWQKARRKIKQQILVKKGRLNITS